jgi:hypothetical protein
MKTLVLAACLGVVSFGVANAQQHVRGHYRHANPYTQPYRTQPQYIQPHYRSAPDSSYNNNWGVRPNVNPYSGQRGSLSPTWNDRAPSRSSFGSPYGGFGR